jgi:hypothetical protein
MDKEKTKADLAYIQKIFKIDPIDWARYENGRLSFISPTGQKFVYTEDMLEQIERDLKSIAVPPALPPAKPAASKPKPESRAKGK